MKANTYLKTYLHILIQPVTYCYISVKRGMYLHHETRNIAFAETSPNLAKFHVKGSQCHESQYLPKGSFKQLEPHPPPPSPHFYRFTQSVTILIHLILFSRKISSVFV